MADPNF